MSVCCEQRELLAIYTPGAQRRDVPDGASEKKKKKKEKKRKEKKRKERKGKDRKGKERKRYISQEKSEVTVTVAARGTVFTIPIPMIPRSLAGEQACPQFRQWRSLIASTIDVVAASLSSSRTHDDGVRDSPAGHLDASIKVLIESSMPRVWLLCRPEPYFDDAGWEEKVPLAAWRKQRQRHRQQKQEHRQKKKKKSHGRGGGSSNNKKKTKVAFQDLADYEHGAHESGERRHHYDHHSGEYDNDSSDYVSSTNPPNSSPDSESYAPREATKLATNCHHPAVARPPSSDLSFTIRGGSCDDRTAARPVSSTAMLSKKKKKKKKKRRKPSVSTIAAGAWGGAMKISHPPPPPPPPPPPSSPSPSPATTTTAAAAAATSKTTRISTAAPLASTLAASESPPTAVGVRSRINVLLARVWPRTRLHPHSRQRQSYERTSTGAGYVEDVMPNEAGRVLKKRNGLYAFGPGELPDPRESGDGGNVWLRMEFSHTDIRSCGQRGCECL